jgi:hypothetical protein
MNISEPYVPDAWTLSCRKQLEGMMVDASAIRSDAAKKAAAEDSSDYDDLMKAADARATLAIQARAALSAQMYREECDATRNWVASQKAQGVAASVGTINLVSEDPAGGLLPCGDQKVVPLKRTPKINAVPQPAYFSLAWSDAITENMETVDRIARALEEENGGKRSKRHEKLLLQKYFVAVGSPLNGGIGRSGYPEHVEKRVNRYLWLERAFETGKAIYPKGYPQPFTQDEQQALHNKLRTAGVPKDGIQQLISSLRKLVKRDSRHRRTH